MGIIQGDTDKTRTEYCSVHEKITEIHLAHHIIEQADSYPIRILSRTPRRSCCEARVMRSMTNFTCAPLQPAGGL